MNRHSRDPLSQP